VAGLVENRGPGEAADARVTATLLDANGQPVGTGETTWLPAVAPPGEVGVWKISIAGTPQFKDARLQVQARPATDQDRARAGTTFEVTNVALTDKKITGQVTNTGPKAASQIRVALAIYGADGGLQMVLIGAPERDQLAPNQTAPFTLTPDHDLPTIERYESFVQGTTP
jgi:hypothetical protein